MKKEEAKKETEKLQTYRDIFESANPEQIKPILEDMMKLTETDFIDNYYADFNAFKRMHDIILPKLTDESKRKILKFTLPKARDIIEKNVTKIALTFQNNKPYWTKFVVENDETKKKYATITNELLKTHLYNFNDLFTINHLRYQEQLIYGTGIRKVYYERKEEKFYDFQFKKNIDVNVVNSKQSNQNIQNKNQEQSQKYNFELIPKTEVVSDSCKIDFRSIWDMRFCPAIINSTEITNGGWGYEFSYPSIEWCRAVFSNFEDYLKNYIELGKINMLDDEDNYNNPDTKDNKSNSKKKKRQYNPCIVEFYIYQFRFFLLVESKFDNTKIIDIMIPRNKSGLEAFINPFNHRQFPYIITYYKPRPDSIYGDGLMKELFNNQVLDDFMLNITVDNVILKTRPPIGINNNFVDFNSFQTSLNGKGQIFKLKDYNQQTNNNNPLIWTYQNSLATGETSQLSQYFESQNQSRSAIPNQSAFPQSNAAVKTLGGLQLADSQIQEMIKYINALNEFEEKKLLLMCLSNIFQYQNEDLIIKINGDNGAEYITIRNEFNNKIKKLSDIQTSNNEQQAPETDVDNIKPTKDNDGREIVLIDELVKLNYTFEIKFNTANAQLRFSQLTQALNLALQLLRGGLLDYDQTAIIINEYFSLLEVDVILKTNETDKEKINRENAKFVSLYNIFQPLLFNKQISEDQFVELVYNAIEDPDAKNDIHANHIQYHDSRMQGSRHLSLHQEYEARQQELEAQMRLEAEQKAQGQSDGRITAPGGITKQSSETQPPQQQAQPQINNQNQGAV